jgi:3-dehydroquinate synthase
MKIITVNASKTYDIFIGADILGETGILVRKTAGGQAAAIVTDDNVAALYEKRLSAALENNGYRVVKFVFPRGEASKNAGTFLSLLNFLAEERLSRTDIIIALGGGVTGDIAGFAAACYMRGIKYIQIPTTLLAAVDSSVGGKTAVNLAAGKNLAGAFYQPEAVICDTSLLSSLPPEAYRDGCAEIIKYGVLADRTLFESLITPVAEELESVIARCVEIKRDIVAEDEFENGARKILNLGHTVGHSIELLSKYNIPHGAAVAAGMAIITRAAVHMGICEIDCLRDILGMLRLYGLPADTPYEAERIAQACLSDKKRDGGHITMIFPVKIGKCILKDIPVEDLATVIQMGLKVL